MLTVLTLIIAFFSTACGNYQPPSLPETYFVEGTLVLPYAEISEPFSAWYDGIKKKSRVDMYGGLTRSIQHEERGKYGTRYLIAPVSTERYMNRQTCFEVKGSSDAPAKIQPMFPDLTNFTFVGNKTYADRPVREFQLKKTTGSKTGRYTVYIDIYTNVPVYYEMDGYNTLTGSHFDEYKITYDVMAMNFSETVFDYPISGMDCIPFPGPGYEARIVANPMKEFIHPIDDSHLHPMHQNFRKKYNKKIYDDHEEEFKRKHIFKHNLRYIHSMNRQNLTFKLKVNHLAEHTSDELRSLRGRRTTPFADRKGFGRKGFVKTGQNIPSEVNWRLRGAVTPVKDQSVCGSCWSYGSTGTVEGTYFLKTGRLLRLSQQNLVDCSWGYGNNGCDGGEEYRSFEYMMKHGVRSEDDYGHYLGADSFCHTDVVPVSLNISGYVNVTSGDIDALKMAIATKGPVSVGIDAAHLSFVFYSNGVYYEPDCGNKLENLDHAVLAVGYGQIDGTPYWDIKNSWSTHWGNDGYVLMSRKNNNCGVATDATFVYL